MDEIWKSISGFDGYEVSNLGTVRSFHKRLPGGGNWEIADMPQRILSGGMKGRYRYVSLRCNGKSRSIPIHQLVMLAFIGPPPEEMEVCHNNGDPLDNRLENLRYDTHIGNMRDLCPLTDREIIEVRKKRINGHSIKALSEEYEIPTLSVSDICLHKRYTQVGGPKAINIHASHILTSDQVTEIRKRCSNGEAQSSIANDYNVSRSEISLIVRGLRLRNIGEWPTEH